MYNRKTILSAAIATAMGGVSFSASAALTSTATLDFTLGAPGTTGCLLGTVPPCTNPAFNVTDIVGSYFSMDTDGSGSVEIAEKTPIGSFNGLHFGSAQAAGGSHSGIPNGTESPNIDAPWAFFGNTGMHQTTAPTTDNGDGTINLAWDVTWNGIPNIPLNATSATTIVCSTATCSDSSDYTIDGAFHVAGAGFTTVGYTVHLEGHVSSPAAVVPVPAAAWLFGSGLVGLAGIARRRKSK